MAGKAVAFEARSSSTGGGVSLSTSFAAIPVGQGTTGGDTTSSPIPDDCILGLAMIQISSIAGGAANIIWFIALDLAGDVPLTPQRTDAIAVGKTTATSGSVTRSIGVAYLRNPAITATQGALYIIAKTDAGTAKGIGHIYASREL